MNNSINLTALSSLEKVFPGDEIPAAFAGFSMLKNERASFQTAYRYGGEADCAAVISVESELAPFIRAYQVDMIPAGSVAPKHADDYFITKKAGDFPELLTPVENGKITLKAGGVFALWFEIKAEDVLPAGRHSVTVKISADGNELGSASLSVEVIDALLPKQSLIFTNWFHTDCLASHYKVKVFSEEYWRITENFLRRAREFGMNMVLTPVFTPPLDTKVGGERPTVQLVDVEVTGRNEYSFGFEKFDRWVEMCRRCEIDWFEISHFFTQWGAKHAPKIVAKTAKGEEKIFGWKTRASGKRYREFIAQFAKAFIAHLEKLGIREQCVLHVSDEPNKRQVRSYKKASAIVHRNFPGFRVIDALSDFKYHQKKLVDIPVPANNYIEPFIGNVPELWTYYCCSQCVNNVSNRFFGMPSERNRVLGYQLYKFNATGFLHWGFNFWYSQFSVREIDPFTETDAGGAFFSGDAFVVYPAKDGTPLNSLRLHVFYDAFQDMMALQLLESKISREKTVALLEQDADKPITFSDYPHSKQWLLGTREKINQAIKEA